MGSQMQRVVAHLRIKSDVALMTADDTSTFNRRFMEMYQVSLFKS